MFFIILLVAVILLITCSLRGYYNFFKKKKHGRILFFVLLILSIVNLIIAVKKSKFIPFEFLKNVSYFIAVVTFITFIYSAFLFGVKWIILKIANCLKCTQGKFISFLSSEGKTSAVIFALMILLSTAGYINMGTFRQTDYTVRVDKSAEISELNCAVISDTHIGVGVHADRLDELVEKINRLNPDVIFLVGDIVDESTTQNDIDKMVKSFQGLKSKMGTFYVSGNHERYAGFDFNKYMENAGVTVLSDEAVTVGGNVTIIGRKDAYAQRKELSEICKSNLSQSGPLIVLNHEPLQLEKMSREGADVTISGHTHGEQFPFTKALFSLANDMMYGTKKYGKMTAVTTSGAGGWGLHFKLPAKSEIVNLKIIFK